MTAKRFLPEGFVTGKRNLLLLSPGRFCSAGHNLPMTAEHNLLKIENFITVRRFYSAKHNISTTAKHNISTTLSTAKHNLLLSVNFIN